MPLFGSERCEALPKLSEVVGAQRWLSRKTEPSGSAQAARASTNCCAQSRNWLACRLKDARSQPEASKRSGGASLSAFVRRKVAIAHSSSEAIARRFRSAISEGARSRLFSIAFPDASLFSEADWSAQGSEGRRASSHSWGAGKSFGLRCSMVACPGIPAAARGRRRAAADVVSRSEAARPLGRATDEHLLRLLAEVDLGHGFLRSTTWTATDAAREETMPAAAESA